MAPHTPKTLCEPQSMMSLITAVVTVRCAGSQGVLEEGVVTSTGRLRKGGPEKPAAAGREEGRAEKGRGTACASPRQAWDRGGGGGASYYWGTRCPGDLG